jgi:ribosomal protein S2
MTHDILDCLVIINENKTSMAIVEANQLQIPIVSLVDFNLPNI